VLQTTTILIIVMEQTMVFSNLSILSNHLCKLKPDNIIFFKIMENHESIIGKSSNQVVSIRNDVQALQERTNTVAAQLAKISESQTLILAKFCRKA
jgi:hypothetical protein